MQTRNLECQLAMAQLKRYLSGTKLSDDALEALESHLVDCPICRLAVQAQKVHSEEPILPTQAVVQTPAPTPEPKKSLMKGHMKTLALSVALATVLVAMSMIANDPTKLFGDRLMAPGATTKPKPVKNDAAITPRATKASTPPKVVASAEAVRKEVAEPKTQSPEPLPETSPRSEVRKRPDASKQPAPARRRSAAKPKQPESGITVYDPQGNPL